MKELSIRLNFACLDFTVLTSLEIFWRTVSQVAKAIDVVLMFLSLVLYIVAPLFSVSVVDFEQLEVYWTSFDNVLNLKIFQFLH